MGLSREPAAGSASLPHPSANPVGGRRKKGTRPHVSRAARRLLCVLAAAAAVLVAPAGPAHATPSPGSVEDQIDAQWNKLEPIIEQYNNVHNKLIANRRSQAALQKRLTPLEVQVNVAMVQVRGLAADAYKQGSPGAVNAMIMTGDAT